MEHPSSCLSENSFFREKKQLKLTGFAYEIGLNEFAISDEKDYITKIMIKTEKLS